MTLLEILISGTIMGILTALSIPSLLSMHKSMQIKSTAEALRNSLIEAQRIAISRSQECPINFVKSPNGTIARIETSRQECLKEKLNLPNHIILSSQSENLSFSFRGFPNNPTTILISAPNYTNKVRCVEVFNGLGLITSGIYQNSICQSPQRFKS